MDVLGGFVDRAAEQRFRSAHEEAMALWPAHRAADVATSFGRVRTYVSGPEDGPAIVLLPGGGATAASWAPVAARLAGSHRVHAMDLLGDAGLSVPSRPATSPEDAAAWLAEVLDELGPRPVHLVGFSHGGWYALNLAVRSPGRLAAVIAIEPAAALGPLRAGYWARLLVALLSGSDAVRLRYLAWARRGAAPTGPMRALLLSGLRDHRTRAMARPRRLSDDDLRAITVPALVLLGARSPVHDPARAAARARSLMPQARVEVVPGAAHALPADQPDEVVGLVLAFLDGIR